MRTYTTDLSNKPCCSVVGCNRLVVKKKMCSKHYQQVKTHGEVRPDRYNVNEYEDTGDYTILHIKNDSKGMHVRVKVDSSDVPLLKTKRWHITSSGYVMSKQGSAHQIVLGGSSRKQQIDHINGDTLDNRKCNLRHCDPHQNQQNRKISISNRSGYKGVCWKASKGKWVANIRLNGKMVHLGCFESAELAAVRYNHVAKANFGLFARLNGVVII